MSQGCDKLSGTLINTSFFPLGTCSAARPCQIDNSERAFQDVFERFQDRIVPSA
jgi:hypothetical protein